jgi:hypothetical protein
MGWAFRVGAAASILLHSCSFTSTTEVTLPALDASKTMTANALIVQTDYWRGLDSPIKVIRGSGEGAAVGAGGYLYSTVAIFDPITIIFMILLAPIGIPVSAAVGAGLAHSEEEVDAAVGAFKRTAQDTALLGSIDRRFVKALEKGSADHWACVGVASKAEQEPCTGYTPVARLNLRPAFFLQSEGAFDPDIELFGSVVGSVSMDQSLSDAGVDVVLEAKWAYHEELGTFFALAEDDASLLRRKLDSILDRFATRIAEDLYLTPLPEVIVGKEKPFGLSFTETPQGVVVRVKQGFDLTSLATHGVVRPTSRSFGERCWIDAVEKKPTGHSHGTLPINRNVIVKAGRALVVVSCITHRGSINEKLEHHNIEISVEPGVVYVTDGRTYETCWENIGLMLSAPYNMAECQ